MTEILKNSTKSLDAKRQLLATASAIALIGAAYNVDIAQAAEENSSKPTVWLELGGGLSALDDGQQEFAPPIMDGRPSIFAPAGSFQKPPANSFDAFGKLSLAPSETDWVFSASLRYGRSKSQKDVRQQTHPGPFKKYYYSNYPTIGGQTTRLRRNITAYPNAAKFADTQLQASEQHLIVDFQAGKDVGLGMFGLHGSSIVSIGVRFAQFISKSNISLKSNPDWRFQYKYFPSVVSTLRPSSKFPQGEVFHSNQASLHAERSFRGIGPSLSWSASNRILGHHPDAEVTLDLGINAAVLFGRQRARLQHQASGAYHGAKYSKGLRVPTYDPGPVHATRSRSVVVPNVGGFAGLSFRYVNAKLSFGYRADYFFDAMDGGIDTSRSYDRGFHGPYATLSIGLGG